MSTLEKGDLVTASDLGERFGVSAGTIRSWYRRGLIPGIRISKTTLRFSLREVIAALRS
jgi:DNA-binding transcriptional MerR regulator